MKFTNKATVPVAAERIDLSKWLFTMTDQEYQASAAGHRALGAFIDDEYRSADARHIDLLLHCRDRSTGSSSEPVGSDGVRGAVGKHVEEETAGYAADLSRKL